MFADKNDDKLLVKSGSVKIKMNNQKQNDQILHYSNSMKVSGLNSLNDKKNSIAGSSWLKELQELDIINQKNNKQFKYNCLEDKNYFQSKIQQKQQSKEQLAQKKKGNTNWIGESEIQKSAPSLQWQFNPVPKPTLQQLEKKVSAYEQQSQTKYQQNQVCQKTLLKNNTQLLSQIQNMMGSSKFDDKDTSLNAIINNQPTNKQQSQTVIATIITLDQPTKVILVNSSKICSITKAQQFIYKCGEIETFFDQFIWQVEETLGVSHDSTSEEIEKAYKRMVSVLNLKENPELKVYCDDLRLAYDTLINEDSRGEYDEYISQHIKLSRLWKEMEKEEVDDEETERRKKERGKRRFEEDFDYANEEFFASWKSRFQGSGQQQQTQYTSAGGDKGADYSRFDGIDIQQEVKITFQEAMQGVEKPIQFSREIRCPSCKGTREDSGSKSSQCYSCKGEGVKKDPLFHQQQECNTCHGHGHLIKNPCKKCHGIGLLKETITKNVQIPKFTENNKVLEFDQEGNDTIFNEKGRSGHLRIKVIVQEDPNMRRDGNDIISSHSVTLTEALLGTQIKVSTVSGEQVIDIGPQNFAENQQIILQGKGIYDVEKGQGNHIAELKLNIPRNLTPETKQLILEFGKDETKVNHYDPSAISYEELKAVWSQQKHDDDSQSRSTNRQKNVNNSQQSGGNDNSNNTDPPKKSSFFSRFVF
eukprot:403357225